MANNLRIFRETKRTQLFYLYEGDYLILGVYGGLIIPIPQDKIRSEKNKTEIVEEILESFIFKILKERFKLQGELDDIELPGYIELKAFADNGLILIPAPVTYLETVKENKHIKNITKDILRYLEINSLKVLIPKRLQQRELWIKTSPRLEKDKDFLKEILWTLQIDSILLELREALLEIIKEENKAVRTISLGGLNSITPHKKDREEIMLKIQNMTPENISNGMVGLFKILYPNLSVKEIIKQINPKEIFNLLLSRIDSLNETILIGILSSLLISYKQRGIRIKNIFVFTKKEIQRTLVESEGAGKEKSYSLYTTLKDLKEWGKLSDSEVRAILWTQSQGIKGTTLELMGNKIFPIIYKNYDTIEFDKLYNVTEIHAKGEHIIRITPNNILYLPNDYLKYDIGRLRALKTKLTSKQEKYIARLWNILITYNRPYTYNYKDLWKTLGEQIGIDKDETKRSKKTINKMIFNFLRILQENGDIDLRIVLEGGGETDKLIIVSRYAYNKEVKKLRHS